MFILLNCLKALKKFQQIRLSVIITITPLYIQLIGMLLVNQNLALIKKNSSCK